MPEKVSLLAAIFPVKCDGKTIGTGRIYGDGKIVIDPIHAERLSRVLIRMIFEGFAGGLTIGVDVIPAVPEACDISSISLRDGSNILWCSSHKSDSRHVAPDGDSIVCATSAKNHGCNCCPENYEKGNRG